MFQMNFKGIYLIFLNRPKEMFLSLQELTYNHSVPSNPCPIQPRCPLLYILYNSPMHKIAASFGISDHYFADDSQEYDSFTPSPSAADQHRVFDNLAASLAEQGKWLAVNRLKLNEDKTDALLVSSKDNVAKKRIASIPLVVGDASIIPSPVVRNLGVLLDSHLTMEQQINASCRSSYFHLR